MAIIIKLSAEKLIDIYNKSRSLLFSYHVRGNKNALEPTGETKFPSLNDAQQYFEEGNFARPLLEANRILKVNPEHDNALNIEYEAISIRSMTINVAIFNQNEAKKTGLNKIPLYLDLVEDGKALGRNKEYTKAIEKIEEAIKLLPDKIEAHWGLATLLHKTEKHVEALKEYDWLRERKMEREEGPENLRFDFEAGQVMLKIKERRVEGISLIRKVIKKDPASYGQYEKELKEIEPK